MTTSVVDRSSHQAAPLTHCQAPVTYAVLSSDAALPYYTGVRLFREHAAFIYSAPFKRDIKVVDLKTGQASYFPENDLYLKDAGNRFFSVKGIDGEIAYHKNGGILNAIHLSTLNKTVVTPRRAEECFYHQDDQGRLVQADHRHLDIPFKLIKEGEEIAEIPHAEHIRKISNAELFDLQLHNGLLCALYTLDYGKFNELGCFILYDIESKTPIFESRTFPYLRDSTRSYINSPMSFSFSTNDLHDVQNSARLFFNDQCIILITNQCEDFSSLGRVHHPRATIWGIEKKAGFYDFNSLSSFLPELVYSNHYRVLLVDDIIALIHHEESRIDLFTIENVGNPELLKRVEAIDLPRDSKIVLKKDILAVASGVDIKLYSIDSDSSQPIASFTAKAAIRELQLELDETFPRISVALETDEVQVWTPLKIPGSPNYTFYDICQVIYNFVLALLGRIWRFLEDSLCD